MESHGMDRGLVLAGVSRDQSFDVLADRRGFTACLGLQRVVLGRRAVRLDVPVTGVVAGESRQRGVSVAQHLFEQVFDSHQKWRFRTAPNSELTRSQPRPKPK